MELSPPLTATLYTIQDQGLGVQPAAGHLHLILRSPRGPARWEAQARACLTRHDARHLARALTHAEDRRVPVTLLWPAAGPGTLRVSPQAGACRLTLHGPGLHLDREVDERPSEILGELLDFLVQHRSIP